MAGFRVTAFVAMLAATLLCAAPAPAADYYDGKTIRVLVSSSRAAAPTPRRGSFPAFLPKFIPGNPKTIVQNMPGGGGTVVNNYYTRRAKPDGLTLLQDSSSALSLYVRGGKRIKFTSQDLLVRGLHHARRQHPDGAEGRPQAPHRRQGQARGGGRYRRHPHVGWP